MLIAEKINQLQDVVKRIEDFEHRDFHSHLKHNLARINEEVAKNFHVMENRLNQKFINEANEHQSLLSNWLEKSVACIKETLKSEQENLINEAITSLGKSLSINIEEQLQQKFSNLQNAIDIDSIITSIKEDKDIIHTIITSSIEQTLQLINFDSENLKQETLKRLQELNIEQAITTLFESNELKDYISKHLQEQLREYIINDSELKEHIKGHLNELKQDFYSFLESEKEVFHENTALKLMEFETEFSTSKQESLNYIKESLKEYENYLNENKQESIEKIVNTINQSILENVESEFKHSFILLGEKLLQENSKELKNSVIQLALKHFLETTPNEAIKEAILKDKALLEYLDSNAKLAIKERLENSVIKQFLTELLKESAKEILKDDELLRANAQAQAHLVFMRLQSQLVEIKDCLDFLGNEYELDSKIALLAKKQQEFDEALKQAKEELKEELKKEAQGVALSESIKNSINNTLLIYSTNQDKKLEEKIQELRDEIKALPNNDKAILQLQDLLNLLKQEVENLEKQVIANQNNHNQNNTNQGNTNQNANLGSKYFTWS